MVISTNFGLGKVWSAVRWSRTNTVCAWAILAGKIEFADNKMLLYQEGMKEFDLRDYTFVIKPLVLQTGCSGCSSCMGCS